MLLLRVLTLPSLVCFGLDIVRWFAAALTLV
jgi:hypothetical protein